MEHKDMSQRMATSGKAGGHMIHEMIATVEGRMAAGEQISAGSSSPEEARRVQKTRQKNAQSRGEAQNRQH